MKLLIAALALAAAACGRSDAGEARNAGQNPPFDPASISDAERAAAEIRGDGAMIAQNQPRAEQARAGGARGNFMRLEPAVIVDRTGFAQPVGAASLFIPYGWRTEGGVYWAAEYLCTNGYNFAWVATSPDGSMRLGVGPQQGWAYASAGPASPQPGCPTQRVDSVRRYLEANMQGIAPDARALDFRARPDLVAQLGLKPQRAAMPLGETQIVPEGGELLFAFTQNGREMRGVISAVVQFQKLMTDAGMGPMESVTAFGFPYFYATAPSGQLNIPYFEGLRRSIQPNPQWASAIAGHNAAIGKVALEESRKRSQMIAQSNEDISRIRQATWEASQQSADRRAREFGELMRGVETYADPNAPGGSVELSANYRGAWRMQDGSYILSDDPGFDPWRDLQLEGRKLEAMQ